MHRIAALAITGSVAVAGGGVARADEKTCVIDQVSGLLECTLIASPSPPRQIRLSEEVPLVWKRHPVTFDELSDRTYACRREVAGVLQLGAGSVITLTNTVTGEQLYIDFECTWPGEAPPQPPPPPPTPAELAEAAAQALVVSPSLSPSTSIGGLTGLESWLWCNDPGPVSAGVSLRGWTASGAVRLVQIGWEVGVDELVSTSTSCGSEESPSVTWTPETVGEYPVILTAVWAGTWDLVWNGVPMGTFPLGPVSLTSAPQIYPVDEYRGELVG